MKIDLGRSLPTGIAADVLPGDDWRFPRRITKSEAEVIDVWVGHPTMDCTWRLEVSYTEAGRDGRLTLDDDGHPFRSVGIPHGGPQYITSDGRRYQAYPMSPPGFLSEPVTVSPSPTVTIESLKGPSASQGNEFAGLLSAQTPPSCDHSAGRLQQGLLPLRTPPGGPTPGFAGVVGEDGEFYVPPRRLDLDGDGKEEIVGVLRCSAGGVGWPDLVLVVTPSGHLVDYVDMASVTGKSHATVTSLRATRTSDLRVTWESAEFNTEVPEPDEGRLRMDRGKLALEAAG